LVNGVKNHFTVAEFCLTREKFEEAYKLAEEKNLNVQFTAFSLLFIIQYFRCFIAIWESHECV